MATLTVQCTQCVQCVLHIVQWNVFADAVHWNKKLQLLFLRFPRMDRDRNTQHSRAPLFRVPQVQRERSVGGFFSHLLAGQRWEVEAEPGRGAEGEGEGEGRCSPPLCGQPTGLFVNH